MPMGWGRELLVAASSIKSGRSYSDAHTLSSRTCFSV